MARRSADNFDPGPRDIANLAPSSPPSDDGSYVPSEQLGPVVTTEPPYTLVASSQALLDEMDADPTFPREGESEEERRAREEREARRARNGRRRGPSLTEQQQLQIAVWIMEGNRYADALTWMDDLWGYRVSYTTWNYYRTHRQDLLAEADRFLAQQHKRVGFANATMREQRLAQHARRLEREMEQRGLFQEETHYVGFGKTAKEVTSEKFNEGLSKEYRATMADLEKIQMQRTELLKQKAGVQLNLSEEQAQRMLAAAAWSPTGKEEG